MATRRLAVWGAIAVVGAAGLLAACQVGGRTYSVTTTSDAPDAVPGDGFCEATPGLGDCTLRAAVDEANTTAGSVDIVVPAGTYHLTLPGTDDTNAGGDLDLRPAGQLRVRTTGSGAVIDATAADGGLDVASGSVNLTRLAVVGAGGPGVRLRSGTSTSISNASLHHNAGAGLDVDGGASVNLLHTTVSTNGSSGIVADGSVRADYTTITRNTGGGITGGGTAGIGQSIIAGQLSGPDCSAPITSWNWNLDSDETCALVAADDLPSVAVALEPLSPDPVPFHEPSAGSIAMDTIPEDSGVCGTALKAADQRGVARPTGGACDRGAVESAGGLAVVVDNALDLLDATPGDGVCDVGDGSCTLRAAVTETNRHRGPDTITLAVSPTLSIVGADEDANARGDLDVTDSLTIAGAGHTVDGAGLDRVLDNLGRGRLAVTDTTVTGGLVITGTASGGGIRSRNSGGDPANLVVEDSTISGNSARRTNGSGMGGGIDAQGSVVVIRSTIRGNSTGTGGGGGINHEPVSIAAGDGGSPRPAGALTLDDSTVSTNTASGRGGGIATRARSSVTHSLLTGNQSQGDGGGLSAFWCVLPGLVCSTDATITASTISGNTAAGAGGGVSVSGAGASAAVTATTITGNTAAGPGGGVRVDQGSATIGASVVAGNGSTDCGGSVASAGFNLAGDATCAFATPTDLPPQPPSIGPLAANGGPTATHLPYLNSPLVDAIPAGTVGLCDGGLPTDQRGQARPSGPTCTIGSVEGSTAASVPMSLVVTTPADGTDAVRGDGLCADALGQCTLRAAIDEIDALPHPGNAITLSAGVDPVITVAGGGDDTNATGDLDLTGPVTFHGGGGTIDGGLLDRALDIHAAGVVIEDVTITRGRLTGAGEHGAGLRVAVGDLSLRRATVAGNTITGTDGRGGGVAVVGSARAVIERSTISANQVAGFTGEGGGVHAAGAGLVLASSTVSGNSAFSGAALHRTTGPVTISASTLTANTGGWTLTSSFPALGGAIETTATIIGPGTTYACNLTLAPRGTNLSFDATCGYPSYWSGIDPLLGPLADNGGPTATHLPQPTSPARDLVATGSVGECDGTGILANDQRGAPRPVGAGCDAGAVESP